MRKIVTMTRTVILLAVAGLLVGTSLSVASAASAAPAPAAQPAARELRANFGAIAISVDQAWGVSYDYRTKRGAKRSALKRCKNHSDYPGYCRVTGWVKNGCAATAVKVNGDGFVTRYSFGYAYTLRRAKRKALSALSRPRKLLTWVCTTR